MFIQSAQLAPWTLVLLDHSSTYESIAPGLAGLPVRDHHRLVDLPEHLEVLPEAGVRGVVRETPDKDLRVGRILLRAVHLSTLRNEFTACWLKLQFKPFSLESVCKTFFSVRKLRR